MTKNPMNMIIELPPLICTVNLVAGVIKSNFEFKQEVHVLMKQEYYTERSIDDCKHRFRSYINAQQVKHDDIIWVFSENPNKNELIITTYNSEANITDSYTVNNYRQLICKLNTTTKTKVSITFKSRKRFYILPVTACLFYISWSFYHGNTQIAIMVGLLVTVFYTGYYSLDRLLRTKKIEGDLLSFIHDLFECDNNMINQ